MVTHSLIVSALLVFSLTISASSEVSDRILETLEVEDVSVHNAALHKEVELHQGEGNGKDALGVREDECVNQTECLPKGETSVTHVQTLADLFSANKPHSDPAPTWIFLMLLSAIAIMIVRRFSSTK